MYLGVIIGLVIGFAIGYMIKPKKSAVGTAGTADTQKAENMKRIEEFIANKDKFTNDDLEKLLGVSNTTVGRYLDELEASNKITQVGETGKYVYYTKR